MSVAAWHPPQSSEATIPTSQDVELASRAIDITSELDRQYLQAALVSMAGDVDKAWLNFRRIGEVRYAIARSAHIAGHARLKAVKVDRRGRIVKDDVDGIESEIVAGITSRYGGTRALIERYYHLMKVPGQGFFITLRPDPERDETDGYWFLSSSEIVPDGVSYGALENSKNELIWRTTRARSRNNTTKAYEATVLAKDFHGRVWMPDSEYTDDATSPMSTIANMCEQLHVLTENITARLRSRFAYAGILLLPNEMNDAAISGKAPTDGLYSKDRVMNYFIHAMTVNMLNTAAGLAPIPIVAKGPAAVVDKVRHLLMEATVAETDLKLRMELIERILTALDQQKQSVKGGEDTSHWGMWAVADEERRVTVTPDLDQLCHILDRFVLWPKLQANNRKPGDVMSWRVTHDLSGAAVRSNMQEDARQAFDRGELSGEYLRILCGVPETAKPGDDEYIRWIGRQVKNPILMAHGLDSVEVDWDRAQGWATKPGPASDSAADPSPSGPGVGDPGSPDSRDSDTPKSEEPG